jgi:hypothetical protein
MSTTYVFGAGASIHAGYPLASEMGKGLLEFMLSYPIDRYRDSAQVLIEEFGTSPNIEDLITVLEERIETLKDKDRALRSVFAHAHAHMIEMLREWFRVIRNGPAPLYAAFADKIVKSGDTVITFNYDDSLDRELKRVGLWDLSRGYGFPLGEEDTPSEVLLLKLHGSINWIISLFGGAVSGPVFAGAQGSLGAFPVIHVTDANYLGYLEFSGRTYSGGGTVLSLIPPGRSKQFFIDTSFGRESEPFWNSLWFQAAAAARKSNQLVICGYSMRAADKRARELLLQTPNKKEVQVTVVSGEQSEGIADQFQAVGFRNVDAVQGGYFRDWLQSQEALAVSAPAEVGQSASA